MRVESLGRRLLLSNHSHLKFCIHIDCVQAEGLAMCSTHSEHTGHPDEPLARESISGKKAGFYMASNKPDKVGKISCRQLLVL